MKLGRKPTLTPAQVKRARKLIKPAPAKTGGGENPRAVARTLGVNRSTLCHNFAELVEWPNPTLPLPLTGSDRN